MEQDVDKNPRLVGCVGITSYYIVDYLSMSKSHLFSCKGVRTISIRSKRIEAGLTQTELAQKLGVDQSAVTLWEKGIGPKRSRLSEVASVLGCSVEELLTDDSVPEQQTEKQDSKEVK